MDETEPKINNEEEYKNLGINRHKKSFKKNASSRKVSNGILKRRKNKSNTILPKERVFKSSNSIKWDNKSINDQMNYRKNHPLDKEKLKESKSKFANSATNKDDDVYMKGLKKVNQLNQKDEIIDKVLNSLNCKLTVAKRNKSCLTFGKFQRICDMRDFYNVTEREKIFDESLGEEEKLTLKNTLFNKIRKEVIEKY